MCAILCGRLCCCKSYVVDISTLKLLMFEKDFAEAFIHLQVDMVMFQNYWAFIYFAVAIFT